MNQRLAELGLAYETTVFGGPFDVMGLNSELNSKGEGVMSVAAPYGLYNRSWPGVSSTSAPDRATAQHWGTTVQVVYPVLTTDMHKFFTKQFWDGPGINVDALRLRRTIGVRRAPNLPPKAPYETGPVVSTEPEPEVMSDAEMERLGYVLKDRWEEDFDSVDSGRP